MSRKSREDHSTWKNPKIYSFVGEYGPFRTKGYKPIENVLIWLHDSSSNDDKKADGRHPMHSLAGSAQELLLQHEASSSRFTSIMVIDIKDMFEGDDEYPQALSKEIEDVELTKGFGKKLLRLLQRLLVQYAIVAAQGDLCAILIKLYKAAHAIDPDIISELWLLHPNLSTKFVNTHLVAQNRRVVAKKFPAKLNMVTEKPNNRAGVLGHFFATCKALVTAQPKNWFHIVAFDKDTSTEQAAAATYDSDYCNDMGKTLFLSEITVEMSRHTKQYERNCEDITADVDKITVPKEPAPEETEQAITDTSTIDWSTCERHVGALVLRGNRCVLVRSLTQQWKGMRIPSVIPKPEESATDAAIRAVVEFTEVDAAEVKAMPFILPVAVYAPNGRPIFVELHPLYATEPPPDGPLEDADLEDDETPYDWYTYPNVLPKLDGNSVTAIQTMALTLVQAANAGLVPAKWGGVFGQELKLQLDGGPNASYASNATNGLLKTAVEEWKPSRKGDILQDVRKANNLLSERLATRKGQDGKRSSKLPVTLLSGFLGSGKTTLLSHILSNYEGLKVAILVNDMGEINIDAALVRSTVSVRQREEHMVEMSNGCICCTLREDLLVEVANIAADDSFDYLLIESTGVSEPMPVAETFTFEDSTGLRLGDVAEIDTLVTVVDGSRFLTELETLESLRARNWHADPEDQRTISHLLCDQVEFANVIVLNKCDLMKDDEKAKVKGLIQNMNANAKLIESTFSAVPLDSVLGTGLFSMSDAEKHEGWLQEARVGEHTPETEEYGIGSFTYRARKPFLPHKLNDVLDNIMAKTDPPFNTSNVIRAKGFVWLAHCPQLQGDFSLAGNHYSLVPGNPWWAEIDKSHWPENLEKAIAPLWREPHGDRQQEIVVIGQSLDKEAIIKALDECLVSDEIFEQGQESWNSLVVEAGDPFKETWDAAIEQAMNEGHDHSHDHGHGHSHGHKHSHTNGLDNHHGHAHDHDRNANGHDNHHGNGIRSQ